ncbi:hypothetical protein BGZ83_011433 [Gryganskiella cystojenkinii]|nr:hypothetical protein BGZ83_011433 [Gryganskiella cystojenkinii]
MFENAEYQNVIDKINKIRSYGLNKMLTIPQIAILGDQSSGKSSVLEAITKLSFPRNMHTCTRFATQVSLRRSELSQMSAHIDNEPEFNARYHAQDTSMNIHPIIREANDILCSSIEISEKVLEITISGPTLSPLTIIDLPGFCINAMIRCNERTIPIVTKPDTVEPELLPDLVHIILNKRKHMKLGYLVMKNSTFKDIDIPWDEAKRREDEFFKSSTEWAQVPDTRKGRVSVEKFLGDLLYTHIKKELPFLKQDVLALIGQYEKEATDMGPPVLDASAAKTKYFACILNFKSSLTALLDGNYSFEYINNHKSDFGQQAYLVRDDENAPGSDDDDFAPPAVEGDHRFIRSSLQKHYQRFNQALNRDKYILPKDKITELVLQYKGNELPGFISFTTFTQIYIETLSRWRDITKAHVTNMHIYLYAAVTNYITLSADPPLLRNTLLLEYDKFYNLQIAKMNDVLENIFTDEGTPFTLNKYYYDNILKSRREKAEGHIQQLLAKYQVQAISLTSIKLEESDVNYNEEHAVEDLQEALQSYCKVARKRIVDVVLLQSIERHMIKQINLYFDMLIAVDDNTISTMLLESPTKITRRQELQDKVSVLRRSLKEL